MFGFRSQSKEITGYTPAHETVQERLAWLATVGDPSMSYIRYGNDRLKDGWFCRIEIHAAVKDVQMQIRAETNPNFDDAIAELTAKVRQVFK